MSIFLREPQLCSSFSPGDPTLGYYNDLRGVADGYGSPEEALGWLELLIRRRDRAWPVSLLQLGLGAWQHVTSGTAEVAGRGSWRDVVQGISTWAAIDMDARGRLLHLQDMPHTFPVTAPWASAMAQGQAASLLVRAADMLVRPELLQSAADAIAPLLAPVGDGLAELVEMTEVGPVLQEYPCAPASHVLNGWVWGLWGLYDVGASGGPGNAAARAGFDAGVDALVALLPRYGAGRNWSRYDLFPHPATNVASPFYHRLHVEMLRALHQLAPRPELLAVADRWERGLASPVARASAVARKVGFRILVPRSRAA